MDRSEITAESVKAGEELVAPDELSQELRSLLPELDAGALAAFFDLYFPRIYTYLRRLVHDEHLAEDITQDVFIHVHRAFPSYDATRPLRPWVFTIATNKLRDYWRSRLHRQSQTQHSVEDSGWVESLAENREMPGDELEAKELGEALREAVDRLSDGMRMTVCLRIYEGLSFEEIGAMLGRNEVAARKRFSRALGELRQILGPLWLAHWEGIEEGLGE
ncbi:MAG: RNA polymerase sigma-70 factor (ECF subfamily) [Gammaproteobacteria bacterium]|jgi:RNA polymerase sigma-70 factor (ECF subfamily)